MVDPNKKNPVSRDPLSRDVPPPASPFAGFKVPSAEYQDLRRRVASSQLPPIIKDQAARALLGAILFGALLDLRAVSGLLAAIRKGGVSGQWIDLSIWLPHGRTLERRWFPDPVTANFLTSLPHPITVPGYASQLVEQAMLAHGCRRDLGWLIDQAKLWWRLRLPAIVADYAEGKLLAGSIPASNWLPIVTGQPAVSQSGSTSNKNATQAGITSSVAAPMAPSGAVAAAIDHDHLALKRCLHGASASAKDRHEAKRVAAERLRNASLQSGIGAHVRDWLVACLSLGPLPIRPRGKRHVPVKPETLEGDLEHLPPEFLFKIESCKTDIGRLVDLYEDWIGSAGASDRQKKRAIALRFVHRWLANAGFLPALRIEIDEGYFQKPGRARLISESDYNRALVEAELLPPPPNGPVSNAIKIALMLGFRAGLRPWEATRPRIKDIRIERGAVLLAVQPSRHAKLKTPNAKRLLPLHLLLPEAELMLFCDFVRQRMLAARPEALLLADTVDDLGGFILQVLRTATNDTDIRRHDLRHSFASCLAATMLLPDTVPGQPPVSFALQGYGPDCISIARRDALRPALLGNNLGRPSLFALTFLMGHAGPHRSANTYLHLLDWVLLLYVVQRHDGMLPTLPLPSQAGTLPSPVALRLAPGLPPWRLLAKALLAVRKGKAPSRAANDIGLDLSEFERIRQRFDAITARKTRRSGLRHIVGRVRSDPGTEIAQRVWQHATGDGAILVNADVCWALQQWLLGFDPERHDLPMPDGQSAQRFVQAMLELGFGVDQVAVRFRSRGAEDSSPWVAWPPPAAAMAASEQPRIGIVMMQTSGPVVLNSFRVVLLLLAAVARFPA